MVPIAMAVETRRATPGALGTPGAVQPLLRSILLATAATLGVSGAAAALLSAASSFLVYQYVRARGQWGTDEPPAGTAEEISFTSVDDNTRISGWFFAADGSQRGPEVDPTRIGVIGFSMGAAATIQAAARCSDIAAVVADSAYATFVDAAKYSFRSVTRVPHFPIAPIAMGWAKMIMHVDANQLRPIDVIGRIAPRPIMLTHGTLDEIVPVRHAYTLFKAAEEPKELWVVPGAHHVEARDIDPDGYFHRIEHFLSEALSPAGALL